jgi:hypothetical protein
VFVKRLEVLQEDAERWALASGVFFRATHHRLIALALEELQACLSLLKD